MYNRFCCYGGIAQLARACGSYPQCHWFKSSYSHHSSSNRGSIWPDGQAVKTPPFHGGNTGSIPVRVTIYGRIAQLVRALASHARGQRFESVYAHQKKRPRMCKHTRSFFVFVRMKPVRKFVVSAICLVGSGGIVGVEQAWGYVSSFLERM